MGRLYCAYGSNLNIEQMSMRSPNSKIVVFTHLKNTCIVYQGTTDKVWATLERDEGHSVPVIIWDLEEEDEEKLDEYEVVPFMYRKEIVEIEFEGSKHDVLIYLMQDGYEYGLPNNAYFKGIQEAYITHGFDLDILDYSVIKTLKAIRQNY